jgi:hypothetical protein
MARAFHFHHVAAPSWAKAIAFALCSIRPPHDLPEPTTQILLAPQMEQAWTSQLQVRSPARDRESDAENQLTCTRDGI